MVRRAARAIGPFGLAGLALVAAVVWGACWLFASGAPTAYAVVNLAALAIGLAGATAVRRLPMTAGLVAGPALAALSLWFGPSVEGVERWISIGDLRLHAVMLAGPAFAVAAQRTGGWISVLAVAALGCAITLQPDFGAAIALACATAAAAAIRRDAAGMIALACAAAAVIATAPPAGEIAPVAFVENVAQRMVERGDAISLVALALLGFAALAPALRRCERDTGGAALAGWTAGLVCASLIGPYPTLLVGYGAAPILGYAFATGWIKARTRGGR